MANAEELRGFKEDLASYYKENVSTIPISPTRDDITVPIDQLYVQPWLLVKPLTSFGQRKDPSNKTKIRAYKEIFGNQDNPYKKIYLSADAGMGKTSFARKMTSTWCKALQTINTYGMLDKENLETIKRFDLLFYIQLETFTEHCDLAEMITQFVEGHLSRALKNTKNLIENVLNTKQCLIIVDGLDKWIHPEQCHRKERERSPHNRHTKCTVLTTTRPISMRPSSNQIDRHLEICDLTRRTSLQLEINAIRWLKGHSEPNSEDKDVDNFDEIMKPAQLEDVRCKPFILLQLVCIWHDGRKIGNSRFEAYCNIIALSINRSGHHQTGYTSQLVEDYFVPKYLQDNHSLSRHFPVFLKLGERCLVKLREPAFIFYEEKVLEYLNQQELKFFCETGILSKAKDNSVISTLRFTISFQDKSIEEFFTALFMASCWKKRAKRKTILQACKAHTDLFQTAFHNVMNLVKDINSEIYEEMYKKIVSGNFRAALSEDIRMFGYSLIRISDEEKEDIVDDCIENTETKNQIGKGSFGTVFKCEALKKRYKISVAVKKSHARQTDHIPNDVIKEMNVSKTPHPFILPLLAVLREIYEKKFTYYLISPYCEKGDLYNILQEKRVFLDQYQRTRIVLQVAIAIQYLHTKVEDVKEGILHKDICSNNIVLDEKFNARLIDFGLARDTTDETQTVSMREYYKHPDAKPGNKPNETWDYFSFGVVIRELLTGMHPSGNEKGLLKELSANNIDEHLDKQKLWKPPVLAEKLNRIAEECLRPPTKFTFQNNVVEVVMNEMTVRGETVLVYKENGLCIQCMINPALSEAKLHHDNCRETSSVCVSCEKRSFLCPVKCYKCGRELKPLIGKYWGALLIAGNDTDIEYAKAFKSDLKNMKTVMTSKVPLIMGIREENVFTVAPVNPGKKDETDLALRVKESFEMIRKADIDTLIVYISCHGKTEQNHAFELQSDNDILSTEELESLMKSLATKVKTFILFMDRCYPSMIQFESIDEDNPIKIIQINACKSDTKAFVVNRESLFTKYLIERLKPSGQKENHNADRFAKNEYITANNLHEYISEQFKMGQDQHRQQKPVFDCSGELEYGDLKIAYCTSEHTIDFDHNNETKSLDVDLCQTIEELGDALKKLFNKDVNKYAVQIKIKTHRHKGQIEDCETVDKVLRAWVLQQPLKVYFTEQRDSQKRKMDDTMC